MKKAYLAGGCFWGMEFYLKNLDGVQSTSVGFMGGDHSLNTYEDVKHGHTGHAEVVEVCFDESIVSFKELVVFFFRLHDPTTINRQHNDIGTQYRSTIFTSDQIEISTIEEVILKLDEMQVFNSKIVTTIEPLDKYFKASEFHQDYLIKHPSGYNCHILKPDFSI